jgi:hypothetical protein
MVADSRRIRSRHALCGAQPELMVRGSLAQEVLFGVLSRRLDHASCAQSANDRTVAADKEPSVAAGRRTAVAKLGRRRF